MIKRVFLLVTVGIFSSSLANANVTNVDWTVTGDLSNTAYWSWGPSTDIAGVGLHGNQSGPGQMDLDIFTDNTDPTFSVSMDTINTSAFAWTSYGVDVEMNTPFSITLATNNIPGDWTQLVLQPGAPVAGIYTGHINFLAGSPVLVNQEFSFTYAVNFSGGPSFNFSENLTPAPEPGTWSLLMGAAMLLGGRYMAKSRQKSSPQKALQSGSLS